MTITSAQVYRVGGNGRLKAICSIVLDGDIVINDIRIIENMDGELHCHYPAAADSIPSKVRYYCNPINRRTQLMIERRLIEEYQKGG